MKVLTVRKDGKLLCFGPDDGMYDGGNVEGAIKAIEDDYDLVQAEFIANLPPVPTDVEIFQQKVADAVDVLRQKPELLDALKAALGIK